MQHTYEAILRANQIEWTNGGPSNLSPHDTVRVQITLLGKMPAGPLTDQGLRMKAALDRIAASDPFQHITDPTEWQREQRQDRPLPGRIS